MVNSNHFRSMEKPQRQPIKNKFDWAQMLNLEKKRHFKINLRNMFKELKKSGLAGVAQWIELWPLNQKVTGSIPSVGHMPGLQARSPVGGT